MVSAFAAAFSKGSLKSLIETGFREEQVVQPPTADSFFRISKISSLCAREEVLCAQHEVVRKETLDARSLLIFLHGSSLHWGLQNTALPAIGVLYGIWKCLECGQKHGSVEPGKPVHTTTVLRPEKCSRCGFSVEHRGEHAFQYVEHHFIDEKNRITGHPDGFIELPGHDGFGIFEAKSVGGKNAWEVKKAPNIGHVIQAQMYMWFADLKWARLLYWNKGEYGLEAFSEHHVERDDETIDNVLTTVASVRDSLKSGVLPERICATDDCPRASKCAVTKKCFAVER